MHRPLRSTLLTVAVFVSLLAGCINRTPRAEAEPTVPDSHRFELKLAERTVRVQLAITPAEAGRGLMERTELEPDEGMLFIFPTPRRASFWMRNTPLPLDIGYFNAEGVLVEVYPLYPFDETSVKSNRDNIRFALEMNRGWFADNRVLPGSRLDLEEIRDAVSARGFNPISFGFPRDQNEK